jgi:ribulose kinase
MDCDRGLSSGCENYHIGVDIGTGSARALVIDEDGNSVASAVEAIDEWQPRPGMHVSHMQSGP